MKRSLAAVLLTIAGLSAAAFDTTTNDSFWDTRAYSNAGAPSAPVAGESTTLSIDTWFKDVVTSTVPAWFSSFKQGLLLLLK